MHADRNTLFLCLLIYLNNYNINEFLKVYVPYFNIFYIYLAFYYSEEFPYPIFFTNLITFKNEPFPRFDQFFKTLSF
jgi:hypothetical protein